VLTRSSASVRFAAIGDRLDAASIYVDPCQNRTTRAARLAEQSIDAILAAICDRVPARRGTGRSILDSLQRSRSSIIARHAKKHEAHEFEVRPTLWGAQTERSRRNFRIGEERCRSDHPCARIVSARPPR